MKKLTKKGLSISLSFMMLALSAVPAFADTVTKPTDSSPVTISEVTSITIGGETAVFQQDNNGSTKFIRADLDTEYDLESADIQINLVSSGTTVSSSDLTFTGSGTTRTVDDVDLLNEAYDVTIGSTTYTLAADLPNGTVGVSASDPLKVAAVTFTTSPSVAATVSGTSTDRFAGNPWYAQENHKWTEVSYYIKANSLLPSGSNRSAVPGSITLGSGASASGCYSSGYYDLDQNLNVMTVSNGGDSREYRVSAGVTGQTVKVYYDIVLDEIENDGTYYTGEVVDQCDEINEAADAYFDPDGFYVDSGTTVMDIMEEFTEWAEDEDYFSYATVNSGGYLSALNGLGEFDGGSLSGWMYTDQGYSPTCSVPWVGAADYELTTDNTQIDWFYTTDYYNHF
ncbi:DUF4430 domain-containing protein [Desulfosporosinus shakirovi]|uniref:DUF4430 domain-containing protein n=1 Tax=Desulfosporosinus shakirovi TaxID=2885154 RepID=UPI001E53DD93|nr:DUF4430 domain-containing protein [Desulfosporosinus sp. SRJS8]MCB8818494.1 DUF4430 domain-containing protein [Desulfosporosinus sp. SRJS8]